MKEYYLVKCKNNIPFIVGQYDTEEEAKKAKYRESPDSELMIVVNIERLKMQSLTRTTITISARKFLVK